ncbi:STAS/SEC14 domain-containing protein [Sphingomonas sp. MA1305]|uniref:STAS/SEC14 domain-containing protein n=1 Tax=Sphingomonas sp. MA1305 TaxID=2479204 RepID=UPI0018E049F9|nr:STAS/SEC14 domain-containing protein [Sphingomonas sp. MA1305]MBI0476840.1 STAS/SEC14 domain-containing protein [Sphingomonas sp. MA1305]
MYAIDLNPTLNLVDIRWQGLFDETTVAAYAADLERRFAAAGFRPGYRLRIDMSATSVQPRDAAAAIHARLATFPKASRIAIVTGSAITRLQVQRFMTQPYLRVFADAAEALGWLTEAAAA